MPEHPSALRAATFCFLPRPLTTSLILVYQTSAKIANTVNNYDRQIAEQRTGFNHQSIHRAVPRTSVSVLTFNQLCKGVSALL